LTQGQSILNSLDSKGNHSATSNNTKLVHWPLMDGLLHLVERGGAWPGCGPPSYLLAVPNVTAHPSTASVPLTPLVCDGPLLCGFDVAIKGLKFHDNGCNCFTVLLLTVKLGGSSNSQPATLCWLLVSCIQVGPKSKYVSACIRGLAVRCWCLAERTG